MEKVIKENEKKWDEMVIREVPCGRPVEALTKKKAKELLDPQNQFGDLNGKNVLCLASGGGQQSIGFALMGANVTVVDFSQEQLKKDISAAKEYSVKLKVVKSDMRDLSALGDAEFDLIYQPYSINYIPELGSLFDEVSRVLKLGGIYYLMFHNPFVHGSWKDGCWGNEWESKELWKGKGYPIWQAYKEGVEIETEDPHWNFYDKKGKNVKLQSPQEFKHTLSSILMVY